LHIGRDNGLPVIRDLIPVNMAFVSNGIVFRVRKENGVNDIRIVAIKVMKKKLIADYSYNQEKF